MDDIRLPRHVIDRLQQRWEARLQRDARSETSEKRRSVSHCQVHCQDHQEIGNHN